MFKTKNEVYVFDSIFKSSYRKKTKEYKYSLSLVHDICSLIDRREMKAGDKIDFFLMDVEQVRSAKSTGIFAIIIAFLLAIGQKPEKAIFNEKNIKEDLCSFFNTHTFQSSFTFEKVRKSKKYITKFSEELFCNCKQIDHGITKECDKCENWFHEAVKTIRRE